MYWSLLDQICFIGLAPELGGSELNPSSAKNDFLHIFPVRELIRRSRSEVSPTLFLLCCDNESSGQFHQHSMCSFCASRFTLILLTHVDEIDPRSQFHQPSSAKRKCAGSHFLAQTVILLHRSVSPEKLRPTLPIQTIIKYTQLLSCKFGVNPKNAKAASRMLMKLTSGVIFTNPFEPKRIVFCTKYAIQFHRQMFCIELQCTTKFYFACSTPHARKNGEILLTHLIKCWWNWPWERVLFKCGTDWWNHVWMRKQNLAFWTNYLMHLQEDKGSFIYDVTQYLIFLTPSPTPLPPSWSFLVLRLNYVYFHIFFF